MNHTDIVESLSEYRDGVLPAAERAEISRHLVGCASCAAVLADWDRLAGAFLRRPSAPTAAESARFAARVMARLSEAESPAGLWDLLSARWLAPAVAAACAALVLSFVSYPSAPADGAGTALLQASSGHPLAAWVTGRDAAGSEDILGLSQDEE